MTITYFGRFMMVYMNRECNLFNEPIHTCQYVTVNANFIVNHVQLLVLSDFALLILKMWKIRWPCWCIKLIQGTAAPRYLGAFVHVADLPGRGALRSASTTCLHSLVILPFKVSNYLYDYFSRTFEVVGTVCQRTQHRHQLCQFLRNRNWKYICFAHLMLTLFY